MEEYIIKMNEKALWSAIQSACLNQDQTSFSFTLYQYNKGFRGRIAESSLEGTDPRKLNTFLKNFAAKYQLNVSFYEMEEAEGAYTHTVSVKLELTDIAARGIKNAKLYQDMEKENILRKKVLPYCGPMENSTLFQKIKPLIVKDFQDISVKKQQELTVQRNYITIRCLITQNQIQVEPDYKRYCYRQYRYADFEGGLFDAMEMSALAIILLDAVYMQLEQQYSMQATTKRIRILNVGIEISLRVEGFL